MNGIRVGDKFAVMGGERVSAWRMAEVTKVLAERFDLSIQGEPFPRRFKGKSFLSPEKVEFFYPTERARMDVVSPRAERFNPDRHLPLLRLTRLREFAANTVSKIARYVECGEFPAPAHVDLMEAWERTFFEKIQGVKK